MKLEEQNEIRRVRQRDEQCEIKIKIQEIYRERERDRQTDRDREHNEIYMKRVK